MILNEGVCKYFQGERKTRGHLGLSEVGDTCQRVVWFKYNGFGKGLPSPEGRILQLFRDGDLVELEIIKRLHDSKVAKVTDTQKSLVLTVQGISLEGHIDGIIEIDGKRHLFEVKSSNKVRFNRLVKLDSYKEWDIKYYSQVQVYMLGTMEDYPDIISAYVVVYCKDNSMWYEEIIPFDQDFALGLIMRVFETINEEKVEDIERECHSKRFYKSKFCDFADKCFI